MRPGRPAPPRARLVPPLALLIGACLLAGCSTPAERGAQTTAATGGGTSVTSGPADPPSTAGGTAPTATTARADHFVFEAQPLPPATREAMTGTAWRPGCPVSLDDLRTIRLTFWDFAGAAREGILVVHADAVAAMRAVFADLHAARWPIRQMRPIEEYGGDDAASMDADNTSAFNCRRSAGASSRWSEHAYGRAIDINPRENPYVTSRGVEPKAGEAFLDRTRAQPGLIEARSVVVSAFDRQGWGWGGRWSSSKDYQHFSSTGR